MERTKYQGFYEYPVDVLASKETDSEYVEICLEIGVVGYSPEYRATRYEPGSPAEVEFDILTDVQPWQIEGLPGDDELSNWLIAEIEREQKEARDAYLYDYWEATQKI